MTSNSEILLININSKYIHSSHSSLSLKKYLELKNIPCDLKEFSITEDFFSILREIKKKSYKVIGFSTYIWNRNLTLRIAKVLKELNKNTIIIMGGPEVDQSFQEYSYVDHIFLGEGEITLHNFLRDLSDPQKATPRVYDSQDYESLDLNLITDLHRDMEVSHKIIYYEGSRGCPFRCSYCLSGNDNNLRFKDPKKIYEDMLRLKERGVTLVKFIDRTFNANVPWAKEIVHYLKDPIFSEVTFHFEVSIDKINEELLMEILEGKDNQFQLEVGIQSTNEATLKEIRRSNNFEKIKENLGRLIAKSNTHVHSDLIAGLPHEDYASLKNSFRDIYSLKAHMFQVGFLKVIPNTTMKDKFQTYGIIYDQWPPYEIIENKYLSFDQLMDFRYAHDAIDEFHNKKYFRLFFNFIHEFLLVNDAYEFFHDLGLDYTELKRPLNSNERFEFLYYFTKKYIAKVAQVEKSSADNENLINNLKRVMFIEYLQNFKKKNYPLFLKEFTDKITRNNKKEDVYYLDRPFILKKMNVIFINEQSTQDWKSEPQDFYFTINRNQCESIYNYGEIHEVTRI